LHPSVSPDAEDGNSRAAPRGIRTSGPAADRARRRCGTSSEHDSRSGSGEPEPARPATFPRRRFLAGAAGVGAGLARGLAFGRNGSVDRAAAAFDVAAASSTSAAGKGSKFFSDLALVNGRIHTMGGANSVVSSAWIRDGRFYQVGDSLSGIGGNVRKIDLGGRTVVPGLVDTHNHVVLMGLRPGYHTPLENAYSIADVQATLAPRRAAVPDGGWITTIGGFNPSHFAENRLPTLRELDAAVPDRPVYVQVGFAGPSTTNTAARRISGARTFPSAPTARSPAAPASRGRARRSSRSTSCASCRRSRTSGARRSTRWPTPRSSA